MKNKLLYGLLGLTVIGGGYLLYRKFIKGADVYPLEITKLSNNQVRVDVFKNNTGKIIYSTIVSKRDLKKDGSYNGVLTENKSFKLRELQKTDGISHDFFFELYDSKGKLQQRSGLYFNL